MTEKGMFNRLEDFISIAEKGEAVDLTVTLNKQIFTQKFDPYTMGEPDDEIDMYLFSADYVFLVKGKTHEIRKIYASGIEGESKDMTERNIDIANERLKIDYKRLKGARIIFEEKFWDAQLWRIY